MCRGIRLNPPLIYPGAFPKIVGDLDGVDAGLLPPSFLVAGAMNFTVMGAAKRDSEFIARLAAKRARLHKSDVMGVRRLAAAQEARLLGHETKMVPVAIATWRGHREHTLIDGLGRIGSGLIFGADLLATSTRVFKILRWRPRHFRTP